MITDQPLPPDADPTGPESPPPSRPESASSLLSRPAPRGMVFCGVLALSGFMIFQGPTLWDEVIKLREDMSRSDRNAIIGYIDVSPSPSNAAPPGEWYVSEGDRVRLWGGWHDQLGHRWFELQPEDLDRSSIGDLVGRDTFRGIDRPIVEVGDGPVSRRIPGDHEVDAMLLAGQPCAYPTLVLGKVLLVNDEVEGTPLLVVYTRRDELGSSVFEPVLDGRRIRMGFAGYIYQDRPLLYDQENESLWVEREGGLVSLSGPDKGRILKRLGRMQRVPWSSWSDRHDASRVLIGADRSMKTASL